MGVYIDSMNASYGRMKMCHMMADTTEELLAMADAIGVQRKWLQHPGTPREHFDIALSKKTKALALGAVEVSSRDLALLMRKKRTPCEGCDDYMGPCNGGWSCPGAF